MYSIAEYAFDCQRIALHICYDHEAGLVVEAIVRVGHLPQADFELRSWPSMPRLYSTSTVYPSAWYAGSCFSRYMANLAQMQRSLRLASRRYRSWRLKSARAAWTRAWWVVGDRVGMGGPLF